MGIETLLATILPLFGPVIMDGFKMVFSKLTGISMGEPRSFSERLEFYRAETDRLKAIADLDRPSGAISRWVADLRASFRYICVGLIILVTLAYLIVFGALEKDMAAAYLMQLSGSTIFFIIGDRIYLGLKFLK